MTHEDVQGWLDRYVNAWRSYDESTIGSLFTDDVEYRYHPWDEPVRGRDAVVAEWLKPENHDDPGAWQAEYRPWAVEDTRAVAVGTSRYDDANGKREYHNVFLIEFDDDGWCRSFTEIYALRPAGR